WVEVVDDESELLVAQGEPRPLLRITGQPDQERGEITLSGSVSHLAGRRGLKLRRWDQSGPNLDDGIAVTAADPAAGSPGWVALEGGVQVSFSAGTYRAGDYWLIPARTATGDIEWPPFEPGGAAPVPQPPHGARHHYCRLALLKVVSRTQVEVTDCREVFPSLTDITARDVSIDPARCPDLAAAKTVQDAVDILCSNRHGGCTQVAIPGPGWEEVFDRLRAGEDAEVCFQAGEYPLTEAVRVSGKGHLKLTGVGPGTRILAPGAEAALVFEDCPTVTVRDLYAETGSTREVDTRSLRKQHARELKAKFGDTPSATDAQAIQEETRRFEQQLLEERRRNGTLTFVNCGTVNVEHVTLKCGAGAVRSSACVTVRGDEKSPNTARVLHCELNVGHRQQGVLLVNVWRSLVEGNVVRVYDKPARLRFENLLKANDVRLRADLRDILISRASIREVPPAGRANVMVRLPGLPKSTTPPPPGKAVYFKTPRLVQGVWEELVRSSLQQRPATLDTARALLRYVKRIADRLINDEEFRSKNASFRDLFNRLQAQDRAVASQGITVGGRVARDVRVLNNSVEGVLEGVHVGLGLAQRDVKGIPILGQFDIAEEVTVAGNSIQVVLPPEAVKLNRNGVFVGNCKSLRVENNELKLDRLSDVEIEGIRVWGVLGERVSVSRNNLRATPSTASSLKEIDTSGGNKDTGAAARGAFDFGIVINPIFPPGLKSASSHCWLALENYLDCVTLPRVKAPNTVIIRDNFPPDQPQT
ncbi:MAG TPA: DUF6519 domain-containing protein, partial [Pyrinomonadaceae bacterium]